VGLAIERLDRIRVALLFERLFRIFVVGRGKRRSWSKRQAAEAEKRDRAGALQDSLQDQAARG